MSSSDTALESALAAVRAGQWVEAARLTQLARQAKPADPQVPLRVAAALAAAGRPLDALTLRLAAWRLAPDLFAVRLALARGFAGVRLTEASPVVERALLALLLAPDLDPQEIAPTVASLLAALPAETLLTRPLGRALLQRALFAEPSLESGFTALRRRALLQHALSLEDLAVLATQAALGRHAWSESAEESEAVARLEASQVAAPPTAWTREVLLLAAYRPLPDWAAGLAVPAEADLALLHHRLVTEPARQAELQARLPSLTEPIGDTSRRVKAQYEENPYPRWLGVTRQPARSLRKVFATLFPDQAPPPDRRPLSILVAGCGTGAHALRVAARYRDAEVLAVDLSRAALGYAAQQAEALGATNIRFAEADLLALGALPQRFGLIECSGVLHHLAQPAAGLAVLQGLLAPGGVMKLGLYATRGRRAVAAARELAGSLGADRSPAGLRRARQTLLALPASHPARPVTRLLDFQSLDGFRDLVLHTQETSFDPKGLQRLLGAAGLEFLGFEPHDPALLTEFRRRYAERERDLLAWDAFERDKPDSFATMYQFWVRPRATA